jgi:hypothetical protein
MIRNKFNNPVQIIKVYNDDLGTIRIKNADGEERDTFPYLLKADNGLDEIYKKIWELSNTNKKGK